MIDHVWVASRVGHGEQQCIYCHMTNREAMVLGMHCSAAQPLADARDAIHRGIRAVVSHILPVHPDTPPEDQKMYTATDRRRVFVHAKGGIYEILHTARMEADESNVVVYRNINPTLTAVWVRPLTEFTKRFVPMLWVDGTTVRWREMSEATDQTCIWVRDHSGTSWRELSRESTEDPWVFTGWFPAFWMAPPSANLVLDAVIALAP